MWGGFEIKYLSGMFNLNYTWVKTKKFEFLVPVNTIHTSSVLFWIFPY